MHCSKSSTDSHSLVYLGVQVYSSDDTIHTRFHDREETYLLHITRYPSSSTTAPTSQLAGQLIGRFVACMEACSHACDLKESVSEVVRHAIWRGFSNTLLDSVWGRFLFQKWNATDIRLPELRAWFRHLLPYLRAMFPSADMTTAQLTV